LHETFISDCNDDPDRFEKPISKVKLITFRNEGAKGRLNAEDKKIAKLRCTRDLMGRLVVLAIELDLELILTYPLTIVPLALCSTDGIMTKTDKITLITLLESKVHQHKSPGRLDASIVDGNNLLRTLSASFPVTYGGVARRILTQAVALSPKRVDIVFDDYPTPSIKDCEREL